MMMMMMMRMITQLLMIPPHQVSFDMPATTGNYPAAFFSIGVLIVVEGIFVSLLFRDCA